VISHQPTTRIERRSIKATLPNGIDGDLYDEMLSNGWELSETRSNGQEVTYVFTRPARPRAGDVERRIVRARENRSS
jgi:hypothetical protein